MMMTALLSAQPAESNQRAQELIGQLHLQVLPKESGYLGIIGLSPLTVPIGGRELAVQSQNYYLLTRQRPVNYLHWLAPADTHILIEGGPVDYYVFHPDGGVEKLTLGTELGAGQRPVIAVPPGCWKALVLRPGSPYALMANVLSPAFTPDRVKIGENAAWVRRYAGRATWATAEFLQALIGPNETRPNGNF